jgi:hypothetical protein
MTDGHTVIVLDVRDVNRVAIVTVRLGDRLPGRS